METFGLLLRVLLSLTLVLGLLYLAARGLRSGQRRSRSGVALDVLARQPLTQKASVAVIRLGERALVLGVTDSRVELLGELAVADVLAPLEESAAVGQPQVARSTVTSGGRLAGSALSPQTWSRGLETVRAMTVRR